MPELTRVLMSVDLERKQSAAGLELAPYLALLTSIHAQGGVGADVRLAEGESQRTEKRRLSVAAKQQGYELTWRKAPSGTLRFVLAEVGQPAPDARRRRPPAEIQAEQTTIDAIMTDDVAEVTDTHPAPGSEPAAPGAGGRGRRRRL